MGNSNSRSEIIYSHQPSVTLQEIFERYQGYKIFVATEATVDRLWLTAGNILPAGTTVSKVVIPSGEEHKQLTSVAQIWEFLSRGGADRKSLLVNIGGGMLTDLAGFAASTFKRGIRFVNVPTTLLSQVDASVGGKTGINFNGLKNEIGTFCEPEAVVIHTGFLKTIDRPNLLSGFAEMVKHGLIHRPEHLEELKHFPLENPDLLRLQEIIRHSVEIKQHFVLNDPTEKNIRKALNFGHTVGHALESLAMKQGRPVLHGYAVAWGMIAELFLSVQVCGFPSETAGELSAWLTSVYGRMKYDETDYPQLFELMGHDKKNEAGRINFTLLPAVGQFEINRACSETQLRNALDFLRQR